KPAAPSALLFLPPFMSSLHLLIILAVSPVYCASFFYVFIPSPFPHTHTHTHTHTRTHKHTHANTHAHTNTHTQTHTDTAGTFALIAYISMVIASVHQNIVIFDTSVGDAQNGLPKVSA